MGDGKRGQVVIFMIAGVVILLSVVLFLMYKNNFSVPERRIDPLFLPVQEYVEACLDSLAEEGLRIMGLQGGYITLPDQVRVDTSAYVTVDPAGLVKTPLWDHRRQSRVPSIEAMQIELTAHVAAGMPECTDAYQALQPAYSVEERNDPEFRVLFTENDVQVELEQDLRIEEVASGKITRLEEFRSILPVRIRAMHEAAFELVEDLRNNFFLENATLNLFTANPSIPFTDMRFSCGTDSWEVDTVRQEMIATLHANVPRMRVRDTPHAPFQRPLAEYEKATSFTAQDIARGNYPKHVPPDLYEYTHLYWSPQTNFIPFATKVLFEPRWGFDMIAYPSNAGRMVTTSLPLNRKYLNFMCLSTYHFVYDINYPVVVRLQDEDALFGAGFAFQFASPVTIQHNQPTREPLTVSLFQGATTDTDFCGNLGDEIVVVEARGLQEGYYDALVDANISIRCVLLECPLGVTRPGTTVPRLEATLPDGCTNPTFIAEKAGYVRSEAYGDGYVVIDMPALRSLDVEVVVHVYEGTSGQFISSKPLPSDMRVAVMVASPSHSFSGPTEAGKVELALTGEEYEVEAVLVKDEDIIGGWHGTFMIDDGTTLVLPVIEYRPRPVTEEQLEEMMQFLRSTEYQGVTPVAIR